jgi:hypothetical protein
MITITFQLKDHLLKKLSVGSGLNLLSRAPWQFDIRELLQHKMAFGIKMIRLNDLSLKGRSVKWHLAHRFFDQNFSVT